MAPPKSQPVRELLARGRRVLAALGETAAMEAELLLAVASGHSRARLVAFPEMPVEMQAARHFEALLARRAATEPFAYITGQQEFWSLTLEVSPAVLIPRPETELLVEWALQLLPANQTPSVLDLGTGSGAIALAIKKERPHADVCACDRSPAALAVAAENAHQLNLPLRLLAGSWFAPLSGMTFDLIVANPPYVADGDAHLHALGHEPQSALVAGADGLEDLRHIIAEAAAYLRAGAHLLLEHGCQQAEAVTQLLRQAGFSDVQTRADLAGLPRASGGRKA